MKPYRASQDQNPSRFEAGLDASDNIHVPAEGEGRIFLLTSPPQKLIYVWAGTSSNPSFAAFF
jgi:hypothetical protein